MSLLSQLPAPAGREAGVRPDPVCSILMPKEMLLEGPGGGAEGIKVDVS